MNPTTIDGAIPGLNAFPEKGKPKGERLASAAALQSLYEQFKLEDMLSSKQRAGIRAMMDGQPPYREAALRRAGVANRSNLNFGEAKSRLNQSLTSYNDLLESVTVMIDAELPLNLMDDQQRTLMQDVIATEFTTMVKDWNNFDARWQLLSKEFVEHGVSMAWFPDDKDWKFDTIGWDGFMLPRGTRASEEFVDMILIEKVELPSDMYAKIRDEKAAEDMGWDVEAVKKALVRATKYSKQPMPNNWGSAWAETQMQLKSNDLYYNHYTNCRVHCVHAYVREYDGTYSHYIIERDTYSEGKQQNSQFLYKRTAQPGDSISWFTIFCLNIGDGYYHTIRGQGYDMYPYVQTSNRMLNGVVDSLNLANKILVQPKDVNGLDEAPITMSGPLAILSPQVEYVERQYVDHTRNTIPVLQDFRMLMEAVSPTTQNMGVAADRQPRTKYGLQAVQSLGSTLTIADVSMFYRSWRRTLREQFRRIQNIIADNDYTDFPEVAQFVNRCMMQGVAPEIILSVDRIYERRAIGSGSPGMRQAVFDRGMQRLGTLDEVGRAAFLHDAWVADVGNRDAQRYFPATQKARPVIDEKIAELENAEMFKGTPIEPKIGENHAVHAAAHMPAIASAVQALEDWRNNGEEGDITDLMPQINWLALLVPHTEQHVAVLMQDPTRAEEVAAMRKALQNLSAIWMTYVYRLEKALQEQRDAQAQEQQPDPLVQAKLAKMEADLTMSIQKFRQDQQLKVADVEQKLALRKRESDQKMAMEVAKGTHEMALDASLPPPSASEVITNKGIGTPYR